jgi:carbon storage regulator
MLVLTRTDGEVFYIGDNITITIIRAQDSKVRIGIEAPENMLILRKELKDKIKKEGWKNETFKQ